MHCPPCLKWLLREIRTLRIVWRLYRCGLFDVRFYRTQTRSAPAGTLAAIRHYVTVGAAQGLSPNPLFDTVAYLAANADVAAAGVNPLEHYCLHGAAEGRAPGPQFDPAYYLEGCPGLDPGRVNPLAHYLARAACQVFVPPVLRPVAAPPDAPANCGTPGPAFAVHAPVGPVAQVARPRGLIVFVTPLNGAASAIYRVENAVTALLRRGYFACAVDFGAIVANRALLAFCDVIVLHRAGWTAQSGPVLERARQAGAALVFECDDDVFTPGLSDNPHTVDGIRFLAPGQAAAMAQGAATCRRMLAACDAALVSTDVLAERVRAVGKPATVLRNAFGPDFAARSSQALARRQTDPAPDTDPALDPDPVTIRLGYASGTATHQRDFAVIAPVLARLLHRWPNLILTLVGCLEPAEFPELVPFAARLERRPLVAYRDLPDELARFDVNLAPLEADNPFCQAKSEVKYFEAALVAVPTVASPIPAMQQAIDHATTGFLAADAAQWEELLSLLIADAALRQRLGQAARTHVLATYDLATREEALAAFVEERIQERRASQPHPLPRLSITLPPMHRGGGGHGVVLALAGAAARAGVAVHVCLTGPTADFPHPRDLAAFLGARAEGLLLGYAPAPIVRADVSVATFWETVWAVRDAPGETGRCFHFIQDDETSFYPVGTHYLRCLEAMRQDLTKIAYGQWLGRELQNRYGLASRTIPFFLDKAVYRPQAGVVRRENLVVFLARPDMPRRCYDLGIEALRRLPPDVEIVCFGSPELPQGLPGPNWRLAGVLSPQALARLYAGATVGLAFSTTNPSLVPFEMMACGLPTVGLDTAGNAATYGAPASCRLCPPDPAALATAITALLADPADRASLGANGQALAAGMADFETVARAFLEALGLAAPAGAQP